jgi:Ala-tRNA(Pro) deacylase
MIIDLEEKLKKEKIYYELYKHKAIFTNEDALIIKAEQGFTGTETKSLFLKGKDGRKFIFFTFTTKRTDFKKIKNIIGQKLSVVPADEMEQETGQKPGCVSPFGYKKNTSIIVDEELLNQEKLVFAPGKPNRTMVVLTKDLTQILTVLGNEMYLYAKEEE